MAAARRDQIASALGILAISLPNAAFVPRRPADAAGDLGTEVSGDASQAEPGTGPSPHA